MGKYNFQIPVYVESGRYCVRDSEIKGLVLEVDTLEELEKELHLVVPHLLGKNHNISPDRFADVTLVVGPGDSGAPHPTAVSSPVVLWSGINSLREAMT